ncbi:MAG: hypothetical protein M1827_005593 [Pycnora praestabilis]|nr:MAG: hypothetical protein M1827_005593 [Pycnora praestabilis]
MRSSTTLLSILSLVGASPILAAPTPLQANVTNIAGGAVPNSGFPPTISANGIAGFQVANFLENMEAFFFAQGLHNITSGGWGTKGYPSNTADVVARIAAQEAVHVATFEALLSNYNATTIPPCKYQFPSTSTDQFLALGNIITSVGIGAVISLSQSLANTDPALITSTTSTITVEARHDAFFRMTGNEVPNPAPFDTAISADWAYNLALPFIVPGSCPISPPLPVLPALTIVPASAPGFAPATPPAAINFTFDPKSAPFASVSNEPLFIGWVNQLNVPVYTPVKIISSGVGSAAVPVGLEGTAFAALTAQNSAKNVNDLTGATVAGPAVVLIS